jgi:cell wall-associated NlpC family hydrolase
VKSRRTVPFAASILATFVAVALSACLPVPPKVIPATTTTTTTVANAPVVPGKEGEAAVAAARTQLGQPYKSGGESRAEGGFDCSGLTYFAWKTAGVTLPRSSTAQYAGTTRIKKADLLPGDLVFYSSSGPRGRVSHVALYAGKDVIIQARRPGVALREDKLSTYWTKNLVGYGRVKLPNAEPAAA